MARTFTLKNQERTDCATAVIMGTGRGFTINDKLTEVEGIIDMLIKDATEKPGVGFSFDSCSENQEFELSEKQYSRLIDDLKGHNWQSALMAIGVKKLVAKLEEVPPIKEK